MDISQLCTIEKILYFMICTYNLSLTVLSTLWIRICIFSSGINDQKCFGSKPVSFPLDRRFSTGTLGHFTA